MSEQLSDKALHDYLEKIAERGCADINQLIVDIEKGIEVPEIAHLSESQGEQVIIELKKIMSVYTDCDVDS